MPWRKSTTWPPGRPVRVWARVILAGSLPAHVAWDSIASFMVMSAARTSPTTRRCHRNRRLPSGSNTSGGGVCSPAGNQRNLAAMASGTPHILILRTGHTDSSVIARHGDYDAWFTSAMAGTGCRFTLRHVPLEGVGSSERFDVNKPLHVISACAPLRIMMRLASK